MIRKTIPLFAAALLAACCTGRGLDPAVEVPAPDDAREGMIVLGERLADPYSLENMRAALTAVYPTKGAGHLLSASHYYVRFLPKNERDYAWLESRGVVMLDHPMDYEILREGDWYHDPDIPEGQITWQYASVPRDFPFPPKIRYEILDDCYIPGEELQVKAGDGIDWEAVEREAYRLTGNEDLLEERPRTRADSPGTPQGRITIVDPDRGGAAEGVRGVRVACNTFVKTAYAYTDDEGCYQMSEVFPSKPRYRLIYKNSAGFAIGFNLLLVPASVSSLGRGETTGLDLVVDGSSDRRLFTRCVVNNAGYDYFQRCAEGDPALKTPPSNLRIWLFQRLSASCTVMLQQGVLVDQGKVGEWLGEYAVLLKLFLPDIALGLKGHDSYASIYADTVHELAHASHFSLAGTDYWENFARFIVTSYVTSGFVTYGVGTETDHGYCEVGEMWAYYLQTVLYRERYPGKDVPAFGQGHWFHPQIFLELEEDGLDEGRIFQVLSSDVTDRQMLQKKLISYYPEHKSAINQAFAKYN